MQKHFHVILSLKIFSYNALYNILIFYGDAPVQMYMYKSYRYLLSNKNWVILFQTICTNKLLILLVYYYIKFPVRKIGYRNLRIYWNN